MSQSSAGGRGTLPFKAPELFSYPPVVSPAADVYAFAILAWIVVTGEQPYATMESASTALPTAVDQGVRPELADGDDWRDRTTNSVAKLIEACWVGEHTKRPVFGAELEGGEGSPIVPTLERLEVSMTKGSDETSTLAMVTRLIAVEAEAEEAQTQLSAIDEAVGDASTNAAEAQELEDERKSINMSAKLVKQNVFTVKDQISKTTGDDEVVMKILSWMSELSASMKDLKEGVVDKVKSHDASIDQLAQGELDVPRLFVFLPLEKEPGLMSKLFNPKSFVQDRFRLVFLDPVTGYAVECGPKGKGYEVTLTQKWLVDHSKEIAIGLNVVKVFAKAGRLAGLPLPDMEGLPSSVVSKAEVAALRNFESLQAHASEVGGDGAQAATGQAYRELRVMLKDQCNDEYLTQCPMRKERATDGTIEFVTPTSTARFIEEGEQCLVWNKQNVAGSSVALPK